MSLTLGSAPLAKQPAQSNYRIDGPSPRRFLEPFGRRVRAVLDDVTVLDTSAGVLLHETGNLPRLHVPVDDLEADLTESAEPAPDGRPRLDIVTSSRTIPRAAWHPTVEEGLEVLQGLVAFEWDAFDAWFDEEERVEGGLRDPYHRVDVRPTSRRVQISAGDSDIAVADAPLLVSETQVPARYYVPKGAVQAKLMPSETQAVCPYKGWAHYWHVYLSNGQAIQDGAWSYDAPLDGVQRLAGHVCFDPDKVTVELAPLARAAAH